MLCRFRLPGSSLLGIAFLAYLAASIQAQVQPLARGNVAPGDAATVRLELEKAGVTPENVQKQLEAAPNDPILLNNVAVLHVAEGRLDEALEKSLRSVSLNDRIDATRMNLAVIYDRLGQTEKARGEAPSAALLNPKDLRIRSFVCDLDLVLRRDQDAADCYRRLLAEFPPRPEFQVNLGAALIRSGRLAEAKTVLEHARA